MKSETRTKLERAGYKVGSADEFLGLTNAESKLVDVRLALAKQLRTQRLKVGLSQVALARRMNSSQSRVAKMESGDSLVTVDLLMKAIFSTGAKAKEVAAAVASVS